MGPKGEMMKILEVQLENTTPIGIGDDSRRRKSAQPERRSKDGKVTQDEIKLEAGSYGVTITGKARKAMGMKNTAGTRSVLIPWSKIQFVVCEAEQGNKRSR